MHLLSWGIPRGEGVCPACPLWGSQTPDAIQKGLMQARGSHAPAQLQVRFVFQPRGSCGMGSPHPCWDQSLKNGFLHRGTGRRGHFHYSDPRVRWDRGVWCLCSGQVSVSPLEHGQACFLTGAEAPWAGNGIGMVDPQGCGGTKLPHSTLILFAPPEPQLPSWVLCLWEPHTCGLIPC